MPTTEVEALCYVDATCLSPSTPPSSGRAAGSLAKPKRRARTPRTRDEDGVDAKEAVSRKAPRRRAGDAAVEKHLQGERVIVGVDIGIKNLSVVRLHLPAGAALPSRADSLLERAKILLASARLAEWDVIDLVKGKSGRNVPHTSLLNALVDCFATERPGVFSGASAVVLEAQRTSIMKMVQAGLFVVARTQAQADAKIVCQSALKKLNFGPEEMEGLCGRAIKVSTYAQRKQSAITLCRALLSFLPPDPDNTEAVQRFESSKKKDDYGDSLLHCVAYASEHFFYT